MAKESVVSRKYGGELPLETRSLCPECKRTLPATIFERDNQIFIKRTCPEHGEIEEVYWEDAKFYHFCRRFAHTSKGVENPNVGSIIKNTGTNCPMECGLCKNHHNHTALANVALTNRCDLSCWYCFFYAKEGDNIYEPSLKQLRNMFKNLRNEKPVPVNALQLTGGEPTLREDLIEIIDIAHEEGFQHIQLNTDGINFSKDPELVAKLRKSGVNVIYLSFDGTTPQTNPKNHWEVPRIMENLRKVKLGTVLVPTVIRGVNDHNVGEIVKFGLNNIDIIRGINFQPVSLVGRMPKNLREKQRITIPKVIKNIEEQTNGLLTMDDFFPVPCVSPVTDFVESLTSMQQYDLSIHFACGAASYLFVENNKAVPITRFVDVPGLLEYLKEKSTELEKGSNKLWVSAKVLSRLGSFIDNKKQPKGINMVKLLFDTMVRHDYETLGKLHEKSLFVGMMHFMDPYLYDQMRVERCDIHYAMPDGRIIPFCAFNVIPELYRDKVQEQYSRSWAEWQEKNPKININEKYKRNKEELETDPLYDKTYHKMHDFFNSKNTMNNSMQKKTAHIMKEQVKQ